MKPRRSLSTKQREELYERESLKARGAGKGEHPICNLKFCGLPVLPGQAWDESHIGAPAAHDGVDIGIAHRRCNRLHGSKVVTPYVAKTKRLLRRHRDIYRSTTPLPGGRDDSIKRTMAGKTVYRDSGKPVLSKPYVRQI